MRRKRRKPRLNRTMLTVPMILDWADEFHERTGKWPKPYSGRIAETARETWSGVNAALRLGLRGMSGSRSLAKVIAQYRGVRNKTNIPPLTENMILTWADAFHRR